LQVVADVEVQRLFQPREDIRVVANILDKLNRLITAGKAVLELIVMFGLAQLEIGFAYIEP